MKLGPVTKFDKRNKTTSKNFEDDVIFLIYGQFRMIRKPSIKHIFSFYLTKTQSKTKMSLPQFSHDCFE